MKIGIVFRFHCHPIQLVVRTCRPFVVFTSSADLVGCWNSFCRPGRTTEGTSTPKKTYRKCCKNDERPTGTTNWMGWRWYMKIKVIPILILTEMFPLVHETWYLKTLFLCVTNFQYMLTTSVLNFAVTCSPVPDVWPEGLRAAVLLPLCQRGYSNAAVSLHPADKNVWFTAVVGRLLSKYNYQTLQFTEHFNISPR